MSPKLTAEQRQAIDEHGGKPVYVVDTDRHQTFVLLSATDYRRVRVILEGDASNGDWTEEKNARRCALIDKDIAGTITDEERVELAKLEWQGNEYYDQVAPPPIDGARALHQQLLDKHHGQ